AVLTLTKGGIIACPGCGMPRAAGPPASREPSQLTRREGDPGGASPGGIPAASGFAAGAHVELRRFMRISARRGRRSPGARRAQGAPGNAPPRGPEILVTEISAPKILVASLRS